MSPKHQSQSQFDDQSTKVSVGMKSGSFFTDINRRMHIQNPKSKALQYNDIIQFQLNQNSSIAYPQTCFIDDTTYATLEDNFYAITDYKGHKNYYPRQAEFNAQLIYFKALKPMAFLYLTCIEKCVKTVDGQRKQFLHLNIQKIKEDQKKARNVYYQINDLKQQSKINYEFIDFVGIDSFNRGIIALQKQTLNQKGTRDRTYQLVLINLSQDNKKIEKKKLNKEAQQQSEPINFMGDLSQSKFQVKQTFHCNVITQIEAPNFSKMLNSEFGDMTLIVGPRQIFQIQVIQNSKMRLKDLNITRFLKQQENQLIVQAKYIINGLRIIILTSQDRIMFIESQMLIMNQKINEIKNYLPIDDLHISERALISTYNKFYSIPGAIILVNRKNKFFDIIKIVGNKQVFFNRRFPIPKFDSEIYKYTPLVDSQSLLLEYYQQKNNQLRMEKIQFSSAKAIFSDQRTFICNSAKVSIKFAEMIRTSRTILIAFQRMLTIWRYMNNQIKKLAQISFFETPLNVSVHPLGCHFILLFKDCVKFCYFEHSQITVYYTLKIRNISQAKYVSNGRYILIVDLNMVHLLNSWDFSPFKQLNTFVADVNQITYFEQDKILVKNGNKNFFYIQGNQRIFQMKINAHDLSWTDQKQLIIVRQAGTIQIYQHADFSLEMQKEHVPKITIDNAFKLRLNQYPTCVLPSPQLGFMFLGTNQGYVYQIFWPTVDISNIEVYSKQISSSPIVSLTVDEQFSRLYIVSKKGNIQAVNLVQIIDGDIMFSPYIFSQSTRGKEKQKRQLCGREYLFNRFTSYSLPLKQQLDKNIAELDFVTQKMKDDIEEQFAKQTAINTNKFSSVQNQNSNNIGIQIKSYEEIRKQSLQNQKRLKEQINRLEENYVKNTKQQIENYENQLLKIYAENDRLKNILSSQNKSLSAERNELILQNNQILKNFQREKYTYLSDLHDKYKDVEHQFNKYLKENQIVNQQEKQEIKIFKKVVQEQVDKELEHEEKRKQQLLGANSILQKEIEKFNQRAKSFQSLLIQTNQQIGQLDEDRKDYEAKKKYLEKQLKDKEGLIESKQEELQKYVKNTQTMKKVKMTHEYELSENQNEIDPIQEKIVKIEQNIKKMNQDIMAEYTCKVESQQKIQNQLKNMEQLKRKRHHITLKNLQSRIKVQRFVQELTAIMALQGIEKKLRLKDLAAGQYIFVDEEKIRIRLEGSKMLRKKALIRKQLEQQEKRDQQLKKNQYQVMKYQNDNTTLVAEYNELTKYHLQLKNKKTVVQSKLNKLKEQVAYKTPIKDQKLSRLYSEKKMTPFQRYEQELMKKGETTETKVSRSGQSKSFLQSLMKEVNNSESKFQRMDMIREKVKSFVNPQLVSKKTIYMQKIIFDKPRINSQAHNLVFSDRT